MSFKDMSYLELWVPFCLAEQNYLWHFGRGHNMIQLCELIWIKTNGSRGGDVVYSHVLSKSLAAICSVEWNHLCHFG